MSELIGYWGCDDNLNDSIGGNTMSCASPEYVDGYNGKAITFDYSKVYTIDASAYNFLTNNYMNFETMFNCISENVYDSIRVSFIIPDFGAYQGITFLINREHILFYGPIVVGETFYLFSKLELVSLVGWHKIRILLQDDIFNVYIDDLLLIDNYDITENGFVSLSGMEISEIQIGEVNTGGG